jgi:hypothetical protein
MVSRDLGRQPAGGLSKVFIDSRIVGEPLQKPQRVASSGIGPLPAGAQADSPAGGPPRMNSRPALVSGEARQPTLPALEVDG